MDSKDEASQKRERVLGIIDEIVKMASDGEYIYRGQPDAAYPHVSSTLYRALMENYPEIRDADWLDMNLVQEEALKNARLFASADYNKDNKEILSRIQHYSGNTNLIDFTKDYLVALFFACSEKDDEEGGKNGKIFILKKSNLQDGKKNSEVGIVTPDHPSNRVEAQKSVFVQSRTGIIHDGMMEFIEIPLDLKQSIMDYLREYHGISEYSIYNDLHGYIRSHKAHDNAVIEGYLGINYGDKSDKAQSSEEKNDALKKAIEHFDKAIRFAPNFATAFYNRGFVKQKLGDRTSAISDYDKAIALNPNYAIAYNNRGVAKQELGDKSGAISDCDKAIELNPNDVRAYNNRGLAKWQLEDMPGAISDYDKAIVLAPNDAEAYNNRGLAMMSNDKPGAISDYDKAIALNPNYVDAYHNRGVVKRDSGDSKGAIKDFDIAIGRDPLQVRAYLNRGMAFSDQQDFQQALSDLKNAQKLALQQNEQDVLILVRVAIDIITAKMSES